MRILSYKEYVEACRTIVESCTGRNTEGTVYDDGINLVIEFGVDDLCISLWLQYDELIGYWEASIDLFAEIEYKGDNNSWSALELVHSMKGTILELEDILSDCWVDYKAAYEAGNFKQYEWKLLSYRENIKE